MTTKHPKGWQRHSAALLLCNGPVTAALGGTSNQPKTLFQTLNPDHIAACYSAPGSGVSLSTAPPQRLLATPGATIRNAQQHLGAQSHTPVAGQSQHPSPLQQSYMALCLLMPRITVGLWASSCVQAHLAIKARAHDMCQIRSWPVEYHSSAQKLPRGRLIVNN